VIEKDVEATVDDLVTAIEQGNGINLSAASGYFTATVPQSASVSNYYTLNTITFTAPATATYVINTIFEQSTSGAEGGRGSTYSENEDYIAVIVDVINSSGTTIDTGGSGGPGAWYWTDLAVPQEVSLTAGESYSLQFLAANYTESNPTASATFNVSYNVFTVR
jgi:hypothetical protein